MKKAVALATLLFALLAVASWLDPVREGLNGTYYANASWSDPPAVSTLDPQPSNQRLRDAWHGAPPAEFSATWSGSLLAMHDGPYTLATISDDGSSLYVDGQIVVDNGGRRVWPRGATGLVTLTRGVHAIYVRYVRYAQEGGPLHLELLWARGGEPLERMPRWALTPRRVGFPAFALTAALRRSLAVAEWLWAGTMVLWALTWMWAWTVRGKSWLEREQVWPAMRLILAVSFVLNVVCIWWGLPGASWMPDELNPVAVLGAAAHRFGHGWYDRYPPFHFMVLAAVSSPLIVLEWLGRLELTSVVPFTLFALLGRLVSTAAAAGTLLAIYACGARTFGRRAGVFASATFALVIPFVYYAKSANLDVPYLFWFAVSLVFYVKLLQDLALRDFVGFAACATLAICTKDQAYGLYLLTPIAILQRMWRANRDAGIRRPLTRALFDSRIGWAIGVAVVLVVLAQNVIFNARGFLAHVAFVAGPASVSYRDFAPTLAGRIGLLRLTVSIVRMAWGWPMFLVSIAGLVLALMTPAYRRVTVWLALPVVSYYLGFVNVVLYNYDRFMLPVCLVLSLFAGLAWDRWLSADGRGRAWRAAAAGLVFACTMMYAATVDLVMLRDSRYTVEQWLDARVAQDDVVGFVFPLQYYPRLERYNNAEITSAQQLRQDQPAYYVLNTDYADAEPPDTEIGRLIAGLQNGDLGYSLVFRYREPAPWPWLPGTPRDLVGSRKERPITSVLRHINPWYEVFTKTR
jgi:hypothetical protein